MMRRPSLVTVLLTFALLAAYSLPALAQEEHVEFELGVNYPLIGENFEVDQNPGLVGKFRVKITERWWLGGVYDMLSTDGDVDSLKFQYVGEVPCFDPDNPFTPADCNIRDSVVGGDADVTLYGLTTTIVILGEPEMQIFLTGGAGVGEIEYDNPFSEADLPELPDSDFDGFPDGQYTLEDVLVVTDRKDKTDVDLWYEFGAGIRFGLGGGRFGLRLQAVYRRISPDGKNTVLGVGVSEIVPSAGITVRF